MRSTRIRTNDGNALIVPNAELVSSRLINYNFPNTELAQRIRLQFEFDEKFDSLKELIITSCKNIEGISPNSLSILFSNIVDGKIELSILYRLENFSTSDTVKDLVLEETLRTLQKHHIKLASFSLSNPKV